MAAKRPRTISDYKQLDNLSSVVLYKENRGKKIKTYPRTFNVERIIQRRKAKNVSKCQIFDFIRLVKTGPV